MIAILVSIFLGLVVNECSDVSPWCARKIASWSASLRYSDPGRARQRGEELAALIDARPGNLLKLFTALSFVVSAVLVSSQRTRLVTLIGRVRSLPGQSSGGDAVSRYLDLLEDFITALLAFESRGRIGRLLRTAVSGSQLATVAYPAARPDHCGRLTTIGFTGCSGRRSPGCVRGTRSTRI